MKFKNSVAEAIAALDSERLNYAGETAEMRSRVTEVEDLSRMFQ